MKIFIKHRNQNIKRIFLKFLKDQYDIKKTIELQIENDKILMNKILNQKMINEKKKIFQKGL